MAIHAVIKGQSSKAAHDIRYTFNQAVANKSLKSDEFKAYVVDVAIPALRSAANEIAAVPGKMYTENLFNSIAYDLEQYIADDMLSFMAMDIIDGLKEAEESAKH